MNTSTSEADETTRLTTQGFQIAQDALEFKYPEMKYAGWNLEFLKEIDYYDCKLCDYIQLKYRSKWLDNLAMYLRTFVLPEFLFLVIPFLFWWGYIKKGLLFMFVLTTNEVLNGFLKWFFCIPRPYWYIKSIKNIGGKKFEIDWSMPSGHSQAFSCIVTFILLVFGNNLYWIIWFLLILLVLLGGLSRIYLGVHCIKCVLIGWMIGIIYSIIFVEYWNNIWYWFDYELSVLWMVVLITLLVLFEYSILFSLKYYIMVQPYNDDIMYYWKLTGIKNTYGLSDTHARYVLTKGKEIKAAVAAVAYKLEAREARDETKTDINDNDTELLDVAVDNEVAEELKESLDVLSNKLALLDIGERDMDHYDAEIMSLFGGTIGIIIQKGDKTLLSFLYETCHVNNNHDLSVILYRELIGYIITLSFGFTTVFIFPVILRKKNQMLMASICRKIGGFISGICVTFLTPLIAQKIFDLYC